MNLIIHLLIYYLLLSILLYGSLAYNPRMWLHRMPPAVIAKVPPKTPRERQLLLMTVAAPFFLLLIGYPVIYILQQQEANWLSYFLILCAFWAGFDLWDTLILDLLIFCKLTPRFIIIAGTEREDYATMKYHLVSGAKGLIISVIASAILATILFFIKLA
ncbi:MAG: hypothetical protein JW726_12000 [Anaerolineales bacterium]|nr:hypothetical protein [Anaerolineales bacterium]